MADVTTIETIANEATKDKEKNKFWYPQTEYAETANMLVTNTEVMQDHDALLLIELQQKVGTMNKIISRLEEDNAELRKALAEGNVNDTENKANKKRKHREDSGEIGDKENEDMKKQVQILTERLDEKEYELQETREKLAVSEWVDRPSAALDATSICNKLESIIEQRMKNIEEKFACMEIKRMEDNSENTDTESTHVYEKIERLFDSRMNQIEKKFLDMEKKMENNNSEIEKNLTTKSIDEKLKNSESDVIKPTTSYAESVRKKLDEIIPGKIISDAKNS